ncbi:MAG: methyltransferase domain-containing protein [Elusimicrobiota bacterium]|nr:methyltransferase domain-containing protein [Endomicrobiia bacterium]MDW8166705.1 methyltransferase domain-containing protein [Elusimicrobiota bacterium]
MKIHKVRWTKEKIKNFWATYQTLPEFVQTKFLPEEFYRNLLNYTKKFITPKGKVLDIGCGVGKLVANLFREGYEVYGVDVSDVNIENLKIKLPHIKFFVGEITKLPFDDNFFDYIFCTEVLEHLLEEDLLNGLKEIKRVLKQTGRLVITVPYKEQLQYILCPECGAVFEQGQHLRSFDEQSISNLLIPIGFKILFSKLVPKLPYSESLIRRMAMRLLSGISKSAVRFMYGSLFITVAEKVK